MNISSLYLTRRVVRTHTQTSPLGVVTAVLRGSISSLMEERKFWEIRRASCRRGKSGWSFGVCFSKSCESTFNHLKMYLPQSNWPLWAEIQINFHLLFKNVIALHKHRLLTNSKTILCLGFFCQRYFFLLSSQININQFSSVCLHTWQEHDTHAHAGCTEHLTVSFHANLIMHYTTATTLDTSRDLCFASLALSTPLFLFQGGRLIWTERTQR